MKRCLLLIILIFSVFFNLIAEDDDELGGAASYDFPQILDFSRIEATDEGEIVIETDLPKVQVYLNNTFYGYTKLKVKNLLAGQYVLRLVKSDYKSVSYLVEVRKNYRLTYRVKMEKWERAGMEEALGDDGEVDTSSEGKSLPENAEAESLPANSLPENTENTAS